MTKWNVEIDNIPKGGLANKYWKETYPRSGLPNMGSRITGMDLTYEGYIKPGPGKVYVDALSAVTSTVSHFTDATVTENVAYGVGGSAIYEINALSGETNLIHTISGHSAPTGTGINKYNDYLYYSYNHTSAADIGRFDLATTYTDKWWTSTMGATALVSGAPHPIAIGRNGVMYIANGRYVATYDGSSALDKALDFPSGYIIKDLRWMNDRLYCSVAYSNLDESNGGSYSSIYVWDGTTDSWETEIPVNGLVGSSYVLNGTFFQFYLNRSDERVLAVVEGNKLRDLCTWNDNGSPYSGQVTDYKNYLIWGAESSDDIFSYGPLDGRGEERLFHYADAGTTEMGGLSNTFMNPGLMFANDDNIFFLDQYAGTYYQTTGSLWKSLMFDITSDNIRGGNIQGIRFNFAKLTTGAVLGWSLVNSKGTTIYSDTISYAKATATNPQHTLTSAFYPLNGLVTEDFMVSLDFSVGSSTAPVRVKNVKVYGEG